MQNAFLHKAMTPYLESSNNAITLNNKHTQRRRYFARDFLCQLSRSFVDAVRLKRSASDGQNGRHGIIKKQTQAAEVVKVTNE